MERRKFLESCLAISGTAALQALPALAQTAPRLYERTRLVDIHGAPLKARSLAAETNYIFHYPFVSTPCFLLNLGRPAVAEASLRHDYVNGCDSSPVLFLEGLYVRPAHRQRGIARALCDAVASWGRAQGCSEFGSDARTDNALGQRVHRALGFEETGRVVYYRRPL